MSIVVKKNRIDSASEDELDLEDSDEVEVEENEEDRKFIDESRISDEEEEHVFRRLQRHKAKQLDVSKIFDDEAVAEYEKERDQDFIVSEEEAAVEEVYDEDWGDFHEIFGDGTEYAWALDIQQGNPDGREQRDVRLADVFEPADVDEKLTVTEAAVALPSDVMEVTQWCANAIAKRRGMPTDKIGADICAAVTNVLKCIRDHQLQVPMVAMHRRDYFAEHLQEDELYTIFDEQECFAKFNETQNAVQQRFLSLNVENNTFHDAFFTALDIASLNDISDYLLFEHAQALRQQLAAEKRSSRINTYNQYRTRAVIEFTESFCLDPYQFLNNLRADVMLDVPMTPNDTFDVLFSRVCPGNMNQAAFKCNYIEYVAKSLFYTPELRKQYREEYTKKACLTVTPTKLGISKIGVRNPYFFIKYVTSKPIASFENDEILNYIEAKRENLIDISVQILQYEDTLLTRMQSLFCLTDGTEWDEVRIQIFAVAQKLLSDYATAAVLDSLTRAALEHVSFRCSAELYALVSVAPLDEEVLAITIERENFDCIYCAHIIQDCSVSAYFKDSAATLDKLSATLVEARPHIILLGVRASPSFKRIYQSIKRVADDYNVELKLVLENLAQCLQDCAQAVSEFPEYQSPLRRAIYLGRGVVNALASFACLFPQDYLKYTFHPKQYMVTQPDLLKALERAMVRCVSQCGVDINAVALSPFFVSLVQFIPGLGPRKGYSLKSRIQSSGFIPSRKCLLSEDILPESVYNNCASFIRISRSVASGDFHPLDETRVHPEDYIYAEKMAKDALDLDEVDDDAEETQKRILLQLMDGRLDALDDLVLDDFATVLLAEHGVKKRHTLELIKEELKAPYRDLREPFRFPEQQEIMFELDGRVDRGIGTLVDASVTVVAEKFLRLTIEPTGVEGIVWNRCIGEKAKAKGDRVRGCITALEFDRLQYAVSLVPSEVDDAETRAEQNVDSHFCHERYASLEKARKPQPQTVHTLLTIKHPLYQHFDIASACRYLAGRASGTAVVHPSASVHPLRIGISWVVVVDCIQYVEFEQDPVTRRYKASKDTGDEYHDIDQILFRYVEACASQVAKVQASRKYLCKSRDQMHQKLKRDLETEPNTIVYSICPNFEFPGYFSIIYMKRNSEPRETGFKVMPKGFLFLGREYMDVEQVINAFKNGFNALPR